MAGARVATLAAMARAHPKPGSVWRLTDPVHGAGPGALYQDQQVEVDEVVPADTPGAHDDSEAAVVVSFYEPGPVADGFRVVQEPYRDDAGDLVPAVLVPEGVQQADILRRVAFGLEDFHAKFEEVK